MHRRTRPQIPSDFASRPRSTRDWRASGVSPGELRGELWTPLLRGAHGFLTTDPGDPMTRILAVTEVMPTQAVLGGWAALHWLGVNAMDGRTGPGGRSLQPVTVCIGPTGRIRPRLGLDVDRSTLLPLDIACHRGVLVTGPERSCLDLSRRFGIEEGLVAADAAVRAGLTTRERLAEALCRLTGMRGVPSARVVASLVDGRAESAPESRLRYVWVVEAGLPRPMVNPVLLDPSGNFVARTDLLDPEAGMVGEYDGAGHRELAQHTADNAREEDVEALNLSVVRVTALDLWPQRRRLVQRLRVAHRRGMSRDRSRDDWHVART